MRLIAGHAHPQFDLNGAMPAGVTTVIRAAKDPIAKVPEDERILALLQRTLCRAKLDGEGQQWEVTSVLGLTDHLAFGATYEEWVSVCEALLAEAMDHE